MTEFSQSFPGILIRVAVTGITKPSGASRVLYEPIAEMKPITIMTDDHHRKFNNIFKFMNIPREVLLFIISRSINIFFA